MTGPSLHSKRVFFHRMRSKGSFDSHSLFLMSDLILLIDLDFGTLQVSLPRSLFMCMFALLYISFSFPLSNVRYVANVDYNSRLLMLAYVAYMHTSIYTYIHTYLHTFVRT